MASGWTVIDTVELLDRSIARLDTTLLKAALSDAPLTTPTPCDAWDLGDLLGHLEAIASAYVLWVSACAGGRTQHLRGEGDLAIWNASMVARLPRRELSVARPRWGELAMDHRSLASAFTDTDGLVLTDGRNLTVGEHAVVAACEWWVHDWDLRRALDLPDDPDEDLAAALLDAHTSVLAPTYGLAPSDGTPRERLLAAHGRTDD